jgi:hypothetical protein
VAKEPPRVFLLSPARLDGERASMIFHPRTPFPLARSLRTVHGAPIGEVFRFLSGLYFRGKLAYAQRFARPPGAHDSSLASGSLVEHAWIGSGVLVITANRGFVPAESRVTIEHLEAFASTDIHHLEKDFAAPLARDTELLLDAMGDEGEIVLLGSIASAKYVEVLVKVLGDRLLFPIDFVGRGDMSRGGLLLRCVDAGEELRYVPVVSAPRRGARPPKLEPRRRPRTKA